jgi:aminoglycoside phosphotransferase (APT) family kinase protein
LKDLRSSPTPEWIEQVRKRFPTERTVDRALTRKLRRRALSTSARLSIDELTSLLHVFLASEIAGPFTISNLRPLAGGASKEQFRFELAWTANNQPLRDSLVLRREPPEAISETDREREFQVVSAVEGVIPVAKPYWADFDGSLLGRPAMISRFMSGVTKPAAGVGNVSGIGNQYPRAYREMLGPQFVRILGQIHRIETGRPEKFSAFDIPEVGSSDGNTKSLNWWSRVWYEDRIENTPLMALVERWLYRNIPSIDEVSLVHGDFRTGNFLFDDASKEITAVLDWELAFFGDRHADLAWTMFEPFTTRGENGETLICGLIEKEAFLAAYERESGLAIDPKRLDYFTVFMLWKAIVLLLGAGLRAGVGLRSHQNVLMTWVGGLGYPFLSSLHRMMQRLA